jgi:hypothetical protein
MTRKQEDMRWLLSELLPEFARSRDFNLLHEELETLDGFDREVLLQSVFGIALQSSDWELAEHCLNEGYDLRPDPADAGNSGPLHAAMDNLGDRPDVIAWLLRHGAEVNQRGSSNTTPLMNAAGRGWKETVQVLLGAGADVNASTIIDDDSTALMLAAIAGHKEIVVLLIAHGADVGHRERISGLNAVELAERNRNHELARLIREKK